LSFFSIVGNSIGLSYTLFDFQKPETDPTRESELKPLDCECVSSNKNAGVGAVGNATEVPPADSAIDKSSFFSVTFAEGLPLWWPTNVSDELLIGIDGRPAVLVDMGQVEELCSAKTILVFGAASSDGLPDPNLRLARDRADTLGQLVSQWTMDCQSDATLAILKISLGFSTAAKHDAWQRRAIVLSSDLELGDLTLEELKLDIGNFFDSTMSTGLESYSVFEVCLPENDATCRWENLR
jgi:hypothetical protein